MSDPNTHHDALPLIEALLNRTIDDAGFARLQSILQDDAQARSLYLSLANLHAALPGIVNQSPRLSIRLADGEGESLLEPHEMPHDQLMSLLAQVEAQGEDLDPMALAAQRFPKQQAQDAASKQDWFNAGRYLLDHAKPYRQQAIMAAAAAVMLLATVLFLTWERPSETSDPLTDATPTHQPKPQDAPAANSPVAFLLAQHDADWQPDFDYGTPEAGDSFYPGRQLTLLSGFAQIKTTKNVSVLLEGPCNIVFDQQGNTLHLKQGKLSANVPPQAVGFTVDTPTARVVDYGTQFGVEVGNDGATRAAVFTGEVELSELSDTPDRPTRNIRLTAGWSSKVSAKGVLHRSPKPVLADDHARFAKSMDEVGDPAFAYRRAVLTSRPVVYWGFDEGQATTRNLVGQEALDGQAIGQTSSADGLFGKALKLTGQVESMGGFRTQRPFTFDRAQAYTLEAWCWMTQPHHGRLMTLAAFDPSRQQYRQSIGMVELLGGDNLPPLLKPHSPSTRFLYNPSDVVADQSLGGSSIFTQTPPQPGRWVHVVAVYDRSGAKLYVNGESVDAQGDLSGPTLDKQLGLIVGIAPFNPGIDAAREPHEFRCFAGLIDEVAVYDTALTKNTIQQHYRLGRPDDGGQSLP